MKKNTNPIRMYQAYKDGFFPFGRNFDGSCLSINPSNSTRIINSDYDKPLKFKQDIIYNCFKNMTFAEFYNYCTFNKWQNLLILNIWNDLQFLGRYGSSEIGYASVKFFQNFKKKIEF